MVERQQNLKLLFVGDVMLGRLVNENLKNKPLQYPWGDTLGIFRSSDFRICNLECVISDKGEPWSETAKVFHFRSDAKNVEVLKAAGIDFVSLANNHALDFGYRAMFDCIDILDKAGIGHAGAGSNFAQASTVATKEVSGLRIGMVAFSDNEPDWEAKDNVPGIFYVPTDFGDKRAERVFEIIEKAKRKVDLLIVSAHFGPNWGYRPPNEHPPFAKALIDAGSDIIFGHSGHVFRGIEIYKKRPIIYSAGDFIDDYAVDEKERNDQSFVFVVEMQDQKITGLRLYPAVIQDMQANLANGFNRGQIASKMRKLCAELGTETVTRNGYLGISIT